MPARVSATGMLVRAVWRQYWRSSLFLAVVAGLAAGVVGASFQAAGRSETSLARFEQRSRIYDELVLGCPPGVDPKVVQNSFEATLRLCANPRVAARFRHVLNRVDGVDGTAIGSTLVVAVLDPAVSNGWGRLTQLAGVVTPDAPFSGHPLIVDGRIYNPRAADEIVISDDAARAGGIHVGDVIHLSSWHQGDLDAAADGQLAPQTPVFASKVVGVVRAIEDVQPSNSGNLSDSNFPGDTNLYAGPAWTAAHGADLASYGTGVLVRLRGGASATKAFEAALNKSPEDWFNHAEALTSVDPTSVRRVIDLERRALFVFAFIAIVAGVVFVGLTAARQLRREAAETLHLAALGMTRRDRRASNVARALTIAIPACVVAGIAIIALSPQGPVGFARKLEFDLSVRFDWPVLILTMLGLLALFSFVALITPVDARATQQSRAKVRTSPIDPALRGIGPVAVVSATVARGRSSRAAIAVTAIAIAAGVAAGGLVTSYDRLVATPENYGASWDVVVGQYSQPAALAAGIAKLRANPAVIAAAGYNEQTNIATVDGQDALFVSLRDYIGHSAPVITRGRAPSTDNEVALGRDTARTLHKNVGDEVTVRSNDDQKLHAHVVGIVVINDPVTSLVGAGRGVLVTPSIFHRIAGPNSVAQSIVIRLDSHRDRAAATGSVRRDFSGSIREATPQVDLQDIGRLRSVPWLIAGLIGILALATLIHALVTMVSRNRTMLAVLVALGFTRRQRNGVGLFASIALVLIGIVIGIPLGIVMSRRVWQTVTNGIDLPTQTATAWPALAVASTAALGIAALIARAASQRSVRTSAGEELRVE